MPFCKTCGQHTHETAVFCTECGALLNTNLRCCSTEKSKVFAVFLALFLGTVGVHRFYLGAWGWGLVSIVFCWTGIPTFLSLGEAVHYLSLPEAEFQRKAAAAKAFSFLW